MAQWVRQRPEGYLPSVRTFSVFYTRYKYREYPDGNVITIYIHVVPPPTQNIHHSGPPSPQGNDTVLPMPNYNNYIYFKLKK